MKNFLILLLIFFVGWLILASGITGIIYLIHLGIEKLIIFFI
jgi:hypothetical protein